MSSDQNQSFLLNASPDLRTQILSSSLLNPRSEPRDTPIAGIILTSADVDSVAGLLHLREFQPLQIYSTSSIRKILLQENRIFRVLDRASPPAEWHVISTKAWFPLGKGGSLQSGDSVQCRLEPLGGAFPDYVSQELRHALPADEAVTAAVFAQNKKQFLFAPAISGKSDSWKGWAQSSDLSLVDGTFWTDDELISNGVGKVKAREIGHLPLSGPGGLFNQWDFPSPGKRVLIHINNTNPLLDEDSPQSREARDAGWEIAYDEMTIDL